MYSTLLKSLFDMLASLFDWRSVSIENQATSEVIKDKHRQTTACEYAEKAISIAEQRATFSKKRYRRIFASHVKNFRKYK